MDVAQNSTSTTTTATAPSVPRFSLGNVYNTPGAQALLERYQVNPLQLLGRHLTGDWGDVCPEDAQANEDALKFGSRILSSYVLTPPLSEAETSIPAKVWLITEADRSMTTILLPEEY
ncbi:MAG: type I restriction endonuclease subunit M [Methylobacter sp.]|nr:type I restriction endonuclease subunit M [Methylobacter sp.]